MMTLFTTAHPDLQYRAVITFLSSLDRRGTFCLIFNDPNREEHLVEGLFVVAWFDGATIRDRHACTGLADAVERFRNHTNKDLTNTKELAAMQGYCRSVLIDVV